MRGDGHPEPPRRSPTSGTAGVGARGPESVGIVKGYVRFRTNRTRVAPVAFASTVDRRPRRGGLSISRWRAAPEARRVRVAWSSRRSDGPGLADVVAGAARGSGAPPRSWSSPIATGRRCDAVLVRGRARAEIRGSWWSTGAGRGPAAARQSRDRARRPGSSWCCSTTTSSRAPGSSRAHRDAHAGGRAPDRGRADAGGARAPRARARSRTSTRTTTTPSGPGWLADPAGVVRDLWGGNVSMRRADALAVPQVGATRRPAQP